MLPGAIRILLYPVFVRGKEVAFAEFHLVEGNIGASAGQAVIIYPEGNAPVVVNRLAFQLRIGNILIPDGGLGLFKDLGNGLAALREKYIFPKAQCNDVHIRIIRPLNLNPNRGIFGSILHLLSVDCLILPFPLGGKSNPVVPILLGFLYKCCRIHIPAEEIQPLPESSIRLVHQHPTVRIPGVVFPGTLHISFRNSLLVSGIQGPEGVLPLPIELGCPTDASIARSPLNGGAKLLLGKLSL